MLKKMNNMNIKGRLNYVFRLIIIAFSVVAVVISAMMIYMSMDYRRVLKRYAFPQGDIATAMSEAAEIRGASRGVVGYDSVSLISSMKKQHDEHVEAFEAKLEQIKIENKICLRLARNVWIRLIRRGLNIRKLMRKL